MEANQFLNLLNKNVGVSSGAPTGAKTGGLQKSHCSDYFNNGSTSRMKPLREKSLGAGKTKHQALETISGIGFGQHSRFYGVRKKCLPVDRATTETERLATTNQERNRAGKENPQGKAGTGSHNNRNLTRNRCYGNWKVNEIGRASCRERV